MLDEKFLALIPDTYPNTALRNMKPMQVREYDSWCKAIQGYLLQQHKDFTTVTAGVKADGHSVMFECHGADCFRIYARTDKRTLLLQGADPRRFVTQLGCDLRVKLTCELRALYGGQELGFLEVLAMLKRFRDNDMRNVGQFELQLCPFGVHSINPGDSPVTERGCTFLPPKVLEDLLGELIEPGSPITRPIATTKYRVRLYDVDKREQGLEFLTSDGRQTVARGGKAFFDYLIALADASSIEGFVLKADPAIFAHKPAVINNYGARDQSAVKVKREFNVTLLACRILTRGKDKQKKSLIYTYGRAPDGTFVYAGDQTDHVRLDSVLPAAAHAFTVKDREELRTIYTLNQQQILPRAGHFRMFTASCTNMSKNRYAVIGLKIHDMVMKPLELGAVSVLRDVAEGNPHFRSTRAASNAFAEAIGRAEKKRAAQKRKRESQQASLPLKRAHSAVAQPAQASLSWDDFIAEIGEEFRPTTPVQRQASPEPPVAEELPEPEPTVVVEDEPDIPQTVLFPDNIKLAPMQTNLYKRQFAKLGWTLTFTPGPSVTLVVAASQAAIDRMSGGMCICSELREQCPNAQFITHHALKARLPPVTVVDH